MPISTMWPFSVHDFYRSVIETACERHWLKDHEYGLPLIEERDIRQYEEQDAFFLNCRFREEDEYSVRAVVNDVCERLGIEPHFTLEHGVEYKLPFLELQWLVMADFC